MGLSHPRGKDDLSLLSRPTFSNLTLSCPAFLLFPSSATYQPPLPCEEFEDRDHLQAAELIAFDKFKPTLRSRRRITEEAEPLAACKEFDEKIREMLEDGPSGSVDVPTLSKALSRSEWLEDQVGQLEERLKAIEEDQEV